MTDKMTYGAEMEESKPMGTEEVLETRENEAEAIELAQTAEPTESMDDYALVPLGDFRRSGIQDIHHMRNPSIIWGHIMLISVWEYNVIDSLNVL